MGQLSEMLQNLVPGQQVLANRSIMQCQRCIGDTAIERLSGQPHLYLGIQIPHQQLPEHLPANPCLSSGYHPHLVSGW